MKRRPPKPHPDCVWSEKFQTWVWPDDRTPEQREADELAERASRTGKWEALGFRRTHSARVDKPATPPAKRRTGRRGRAKSA